MKRISTFIFCLLFSIVVNAQSSTKKEIKKDDVKHTVKNDIKVASPNAEMIIQPAIPVESLSFKENEYDFGKIAQGKPVTHVFEFVNTGKTPFTLENVQASCGCTTPVWTKDVIAPGETSKITVGYNAANEGTFVKPVTITYNGNVVKQIVIKGEVFKTPVTPAPENSAVKDLKNQ